MTPSFSQFSTVIIGIFTQTMEAKAIKQRKQQQRKAKRAEDAEADDEFTGT